MKRLHLAPLVLAVLLAACGGGSSAPSLTMSSTADHARYFPIATGDSHDLATLTAYGSCDGCHWDKAASPPGPSATFKVYTCTNCHVQLRNNLDHAADQSAFSTWHVAAGVNQFDATVAAANELGVAKLDAACRSCHPSGIGVDHAAIFTLPHQDAAATTVAACADCHVNPANRKVLGCAACHPHDSAPTATAHARVPDFQATNSTLCARCHEDGTIPVTVTAHASRANGFVLGTGLHSGPAGGACLACHPQNKTIATKTFVADFKVTTCVGCHVTVGGTALHDDATSLATLHASVSDFSSKVASLGLSAACLSCHATGAAGAPSNHEQLFPRAAGTKHASVSCAACHGTGSKTDLNALACYTCHVTNPKPPLPTAAVFNAKHHAPLDHTSTGQNRYTLLDMTSPPVCLRCHAPIGATGRLVPITQAGHPKGDSGNNTGDHKNVGCVDCHDTQRSILGRYNAQDFSKHSCLICHDSNNP